MGVWLCCQTAHSGSRKLHVLCHTRFIAMDDTRNAKTKNVIQMPCIRVKCIKVMARNRTKKQKRLSVVVSGSQCGCWCGELYNGPTLNNCTPMTANMNCRRHVTRTIFPIVLTATMTHWTTCCSGQLHSYIIVLILWFCLYVVGSENCTTIVPNKKETIK